MPEAQRNRLHDALASCFDEHDADCLSRILFKCMENEMTGYADLDIDCPDKDDHILTLFEERVLIPVQSTTGSSWEEKSLRLQPEESYFLPGVARCMIRYAAWSGKLDSEQALTGVLAACPGVDAQALVRLMTSSLEHATSFRIEAGLLGAVANGLGLDIDLHDAVDFFVSCGVLSPCKGVTLASGRSWYEINSCLFWQRDASGSASD